MDGKQATFGWEFGLQWLVACAVGTMIGGMVAFFTMWSAGEAVGEVIGESVGGFVAGGIFGAALALGANAGPALLLERRGVSGTRWLVSSAIVASLSAGAAIAVASTLFDTMAGPATAVFIGLVLGAPMGIVQWVILRQHDVSANTWPIISIVAYLLAAFFIGLGSEDTAPALILGGVGLSLAAVTAIGATWLLGRQTAVPA